MQPGRRATCAAPWAVTQSNRVVRHRAPLHGRPRKILILMAVVSRGAKPLPRQLAAGAGLVGGQAVLYAGTGLGLCLASVMRLRAHRREVLPNIPASLRSDNGLPAWTLAL